VPIDANGDYYSRQVSDMYDTSQLQERLYRLLDNLVLYPNQEKENYKDIGEIGMLLLYGPSRCPQPQHDNAYIWFGQQLERFLREVFRCSHTITTEDP
jgi:hypothetical protein